MPLLFSEPPIIIIYERLSLNQLLAKVRARVNRFYMKSSTGETIHNRRPAVIGNEIKRVEHYQEFPNLAPSEYTGYFVYECADGKGVAGPVFLNIQVGGFHILINLTNDEVLVRKANDSERFVIWLDADSVRISMDLVLLDLHLDTYL